jgi:hypothetical protein
LPARFRSRFALQLGPCLAPGLPGAGNVRCEKDAGALVGVCRNPTGCNPQGNVCHYKNYVCDISSARNDCCAAPGNSGVCQLDRLGVPRCNGLGDKCRAAGETCASADDCCDDRPCVADAGGALHCGASSCVAAGGGCTITGDCCRGSSCVTSPGSLQGTCSVPPGTPGGSGGASGSAGAGGTGVSGSGASGTGSGGSGGSATGAGGQGGAGSESVPCAQYGQGCQGAADCCTGTVCSDALCIITPG